MAELEYIYVAGSVSVGEVGALLSDPAGLQTVFEDDGRRVQLLGPTPGSDGSTTELWIAPNQELPAGEEPLDATAAYKVEVSVRVYNDHDDYRQPGEARRLFDSLRAARPDLPLLLTHESVDALVAYLPGTGVHEFDPPADTDVRDSDAWARWVPDPG